MFDSNDAKYTFASRKTIHKTEINQSGAGNPHPGELLTRHTTKANFFWIPVLVSIENHKSIFFNTENIMKITQLLFVMKWKTSEKHSSDFTWVVGCPKYMSPPLFVQKFVQTKIIDNPNGHLYKDSTSNIWISSQRASKAESVPLPEITWTIFNVKIEVFHIGSAEAMIFKKFYEHRVKWLVPTHVIHKSNITPTGFHAEFPRVPCNMPSCDNNSRLEKHGWETVRKKPR